MTMIVYSFLCIISFILPLTGSVELTFELPDSAKECFYEVIEKGTQATVEFQVLLILSIDWPCLLFLNIYPYFENS